MSPLVVPVYLNYAVKLNCCLLTGYISRMDGAINMKFGTRVVLHRGSEKIKSKWWWLLWLPDDVITKYQNFQNLYI